MSAGVNHTSQGLQFLVCNLKLTAQVNMLPDNFVVEVCIFPITKNSLCFFFPVNYVLVEGSQLHEFTQVQLEMSADLEKP